MLPEDVDDGDTDLDPFGRSTSRANPQWRPPAAEEDLWADILTSPGAKGKGKGKAREKEGVKDRKGKGKEREVDVDAVAGARKRRLSALAEDVNVDGPGRAGQTKVRTLRRWSPPQARADRLCRLPGPRRTRLPLPPAHQPRPPA